VRGAVRGVTVIDDFAHHPTAVRGSIEALHARYPEGRIIALFEPRTNTSRRKIFQDAYAEAFDAASRALVFEVPDEPIYSATGEVTELFSASELCSALEGRGVPAEAFPSIDEIVASAVGDAQPGDVFLVMSNGPFGGIWELLLSALRASGGEPANGGPA
jgi:UDP-N-acetylmuramate: L-alanyl-gamma-D-glutamyl-meso-diaminopimelate ligase